MRALIWLFIIGILGSAHAARDNVTVSVHSSFRDVPSFGPRFCSLSIEYSGLLKMIGPNPSSLNQGLINLLSHLGYYTNSSAQIRVGGNSEDTSWWNPSHITPRPDGVKFDIDQNFLETVAAYSQHTGTKFVLGLNLQAYHQRPTIGSEYVSAIHDTIGWDAIEAVEIGNEVDLYPSNGFRNSTWSFDDYLSEWDSYLQTLEATKKLPDRPLIQGAVFCCRKSFIEQLDVFMDKTKSHCLDYSIHQYPTSTCSGKTVTMSDLLAADTAAKLPKMWGEYARYALDHDIDFLMGEGNSASCGGQKNVSDVFGSALWGLDWLFSAAATGLRRLNFHGPGTYGPISPNSNGTGANARPLYYALLMFSMATRAESRLLNFTVDSTNDNVVAWPVQDVADKTFRCAVVHKNLDSHEDADVVIRAPQSVAPSIHAQLIRLTAPSVYSKVTDDPSTTIMLSGLYFTTNTDGQPSGSLEPEPIEGEAVGDNVEFRFAIQPRSAVLLWTE